MRNALSLGIHSGLEGTLEGSPFLRKKERLFFKLEVKCKYQQDFLEMGIWN